jgi:hypothetical protein
MRLVLVAVLGMGCSTALSTMQPADTLPKGGVHVGAGMDVGIPVTRVLDAIDQAEALADKYRADPSYMPTDADRRAALDAAIGLALNAPGVTTDLMVRYGVADRFDAGFRYTTSGLHLDGKLQFLRQPGGWDGAVSLGYANHSFKGTVFDALEYVGIDDFSRHDVELPLILGRRLSSWGRFWAGAKYIYAKVSIDAKLQNVDETLTVDDSMHYLGGFAGFAAGYRWVYLFAELTIMEMVAKPTILGEPTDLGGTIVMPAFGLMARF